MAYKTIIAFVEKLKRNDCVAGILEYTGRSFDDMTDGGDYGGELSW